MSTPILQGKVSFVNYEKQYVMIEFEVNGKKKTINGIVDDKTQLQWKKSGLIKKPHTFHIGDVVNFTIALMDRGGKQVATNIQYLYNNALDALINKAKTENSFSGYLKVADDKYFVKEVNSYLFFPVPLSPWQIKPAESHLNEAVNFSLENLDKKDKLTAKLFDNKYIPEFYKAVKLHKSNTAIEATVSKVSPHAIYVNIIDDKIQAKLPFKDGVKLNDRIKVRITYLGPDKIRIEEL